MVINFIKALRIGGELTVKGRILNHDGAYRRLIWIRSPCGIVGKTVVDIPAASDGSGV